MGCLFALLAALSSFTVVLMPRGNLSHGGGCGIVLFFFLPCWARKTKAAAAVVKVSPVASCASFECRLHVQVGHLWAFCQQIEVWVRCDADQSQMGLRMKLPPSCMELT